MSQRIESMTVSELAWEFNEATVRRLGTDENKVFAVLGEIRRRGSEAKREFTESVFHHLPYVERHALVQKGNGNVVHGIFLEEFSPTFSRKDLARAQTLYDGSTEIRTGRMDAVWGGLGGLADFGATALTWGGAVAAGVTLGPRLVAMCAIEIFWEKNFEHLEEERDAELIEMTVEIYLHHGERQRVLEILEGVLITPQVLQRITPLLNRYDFREAVHLVSEWSRHPDLDPSSRAAVEALPFLPRE